MTKKLLFISILLTSLNTFGKQQNITSIQQYFCPPCGCTGDGFILSSSGKCEHCSMHLIKLDQGLKGEVQLALAPIFQNAKTYATFYVRIIYPLLLFEIAFVLFLFSQIGKSQRLLFLSIFILSTTLYMLKFQLYGTDYAVTSSRIALFAPISFLLWIWPALYFFLKQSIEKKQLSFGKIYVQFIPGVISFIAQIAMLFTYPTSTILLFNHFDSYLIPFEQGLFIIGGFYYGLKIMKMDSQLKNEDSKKTVHQKIFVFVIFIFLTISSLGILLFLNFFLYGGMVTTLDYHLIWLLFTLLIPWACYEAWNSRASFILIKDKYTYRISEEKITSLKISFDIILGNGSIFEDSKFDLAEAAKLLNIKPREMTEFINRAYQLNFYEVINSQRVEVAKRRLLSLEYQHLTNEAIGQSCGFGSKTTFIKSFKLITGFTPGEYKEHRKRHHKF